MRWLRRFISPLIPRRGDWRGMGRGGILAMLLSATLMTLAFPRWDVSALAWIGLAPILWVTRSRPGRAGRWLWFLFGFVWSYASVCWFNTTWYVNPMIFPAIVLMAVVFGLHTLLFGWGTARFRTLGPVALALIPMWWVVAFEYTRLFGSLAFPWLFLAHTQHSRPELIQSASLFGTHALSFLIIAGNVLLVEVIQMIAQIRRGSRSFQWAGVAALIWGVLMVLNTILGAHAVARWHRPPGEGEAIRLAIVQPHWPQPLKLEGQMGMTVAESEHPALLRDLGVTSRSDALDVETLLFEDLLDLLEEIEPGTVDLVMLPESIVFDFAFPLQGRGPLEQLSHQARRIGTSMVFGANRAELHEGANAAQATWSDLAIHNSVWAIDATGRVVGVADKMRLVPFSESAPLIGLIPGLTRFTLGSLVMLEPGEGITVLEIPGVRDEPLRLGAHVCFESTFPQVTRAETLEGAQMLATVTNDAWFLDSAGAMQHWIVQPFRAVEARRWMAQSANTGISSLVDPAGVPVARLDLGERGILFAEAARVSEQTLCTRHGDWLAQLFSILCVAGLIWTFRRARRPPLEEGEAPS